MIETQASSGFGQWLKARRRARDLTQDALAARSGCAGETLRKIEAGVVRPSRQLAELLAAQLELKAEEQAAFVNWSRGAPALRRPPIPLWYLSLSHLPPMRCR